MEPNNNHPYYNQEPPTFYESEMQGENDQKTALYLAKVMGWMCAGLAVTLISTILCLNVPALWMLMFTDFGYIAIFGIQLLLVIAFSAMLNKLSAPAATVLYLLYSAFTGVTFTLLYFIFELESLLFVFGLTSFVFLSMAVYGYVTKKDLTRIGTIAVFALLGIIISSVFNIFIAKSETADLLICCIGIVVFMVLTAYDTQKIKDYYTQAMLEGHEDGSDHVRKIAIFGAFNLYLDFINLFLRLLRIMGKRRK